MNYIQRQPVQPSSLKSVGYDAAAQTLEAEFHSGGVYHYFQLVGGTPTLREAVRSVGVPPTIDNICFVSW